MLVRRCLKKKKKKMMIPSFEARIDVLSKSSCLWQGMSQRCQKLLLCHVSLWTQQRSKEQLYAWFMGTCFSNGMKKKKKKNARSYRQDMTGVKKSKREHPATRNIIKILAYKKNHKRLHMVGNSKTDTNNAFYRTRKESHLAKLQLLHKNVRSCLASGHNHLTRLQ